MSRFPRFLYKNKLLIINSLFSAFILLVPPETLSSYTKTPSQSYYIGVAILTALFFEFAALYYKSNFIYSRKRAAEFKAPFYIQLSFIPRILISAGIFVMALKAMNLLTKTDFILIVIVLYAAIKELWVRAYLINPEVKYRKRASKVKIWVGELMYFLFLCIVYLAAWEFFLFDNPQLLYKVLAPRNYGFNALVILVTLLALQMPYHFEEYGQRKAIGKRVLSMLTAIFPVLAILFRFYQMG